MLVQVLPEFVLLCHCTAGVGLPEADAVKVAVLPALTIVSAGGVTTAGA